MLPYLAAASALFIFAILRGWRVHDRGIDKLLALMLVLIAAVAAASADLGTDAPAYHARYDEITRGTELYGWWDPGFVWLALLFASVGATFNVFVFVIVLSSHLIKLRVFNQLSGSTTLALFVLFCFNLGEVAFVRQYLAASIILASFYLLSRHRPALAVLSIFGATLIHKTALPVGVLVLFIYYGRAAFKPAALFVAAAGLITVVLPGQIIQAVQDRILVQLYDYTAEGFVQGLQDEDVSLLRNVSKFAVYFLIALWMVTLPPKTTAERLQRTAAHVVFALCVISLGLILVSPVFSRLSTYIFPFLALSVRAERFSPDARHMPVQSALVAMLFANLVISMYPLLEYL